jgi:hypothetical protein
MADWPPEKKLPPGFPLAPIDESGQAIVVGAKVRIVSTGKVFQVLEIDRYGMIWLEPDASGGKFSLKPREVAVIASP